MKKYTINTTRLWIFLPTLLILICSYPIGLIPFIEQLHGILSILVFLLAMILFVSFSKIVSTNRITVTITDSGIKIKKIKGLLPYKSYDIQFSEIQEYSYTPDRQYDTFKLKLKNRKHIRFVQFDSLFSSKPDELLSFVNRFMKIVDLLNDDKKTEIYRVLNFYETKNGKYIAYLFGASIVFFLILIIINPNLLNQPGIWVAVAGGGFYIFQVINFNKKK